MLHGSDRSAIARRAYGTVVWKSTDDGETWTDETGDLVTSKDPGRRTHLDTLPCMVVPTPPSLNQNHPPCAGKLDGAVSGRNRPFAPTTVRLCGCAVCVGSLVRATAHMLLRRAPPGSPPHPSPPCTVSLGQGVWYETDFYMVSAGEGVLVKRDFE